MNKLFRVLPAALALLLPVTFLVCTTNSPSSPFGTVNRGTQQVQTTSLPSFTVSANRADAEANGTDVVVITGVAKTPQGGAFGGQQVLWSVAGKNFNGPAGTVSSSTSATDEAGVARTNYTTPNLDFVPVGAFVVVTGTLVVSGNPQGSPKASATIVLRPKGTGPVGGTTGAAGDPLIPSITAITPDIIKIDASPAITVIIQGENFSDTSTVLISSSAGLVPATAVQVLSSSQLRFQVPNNKTLVAGPAVIFVTGPGNTLSDGEPVTLTTGAAPPSDTTIPPVIESILPTAGPVGSNTTVILLGTGFNLNGCTANAITMIGPAVPLKQINASLPVTANRIQFTAPSVANNQSGDVDVFITNCDGTVSNRVKFTYISGVTNAPRIDSLSPNSGSTAGESKVLISGSNFTATDSVILTAPNIFSSASDTCDDPNGAVCPGKTLCCNKQCVLSEARGLCTISGTPNVDVFSFQGSGQIEIITPNVGTSAAGPTDLLVRTQTGVPSNIATFNYTSPANLLPPVISGINKATFSGDGCCPQGTYELVLFGSNFRKCSSVLSALGGGGGIHEILPTPEVTDCGIRRGTTALESPRERMINLLPPDGMTINCGNRSDYVPLHKISPGLFRHDFICYGASQVAFDPANAILVPNGGDPNDVTSGGAITWISESEIRVFFSPRDQPGCLKSDTGTFYVSNDPGRGLSGELTSNAISVTFQDTAVCATPTPPPTLTTLEPSRTRCGVAPGTFTVRGSGFNAPPSAITVEFGTGNFGTVTSATGTLIQGNIPNATVGVCPVYSCNAASGCPPAKYECTVTVTVTLPGAVGSFSMIYESTDPTTCIP